MSPQERFDAAVKLSGKSFGDMSWDELLELRRLAPDQATQDMLAPHEHRAYAREYVADNPLAAPGMAILPVGYALAKKAGLAKGRTDASMDQVYGGVQGTVEGLQRWAKK
jgi:hypothetical protein